MEWIKCSDRLPEDNWGIDPDFSKEKLIANSACVTLGYYDRSKGCWCTGCPADSEGWIDKIFYWSEKPNNPCLTTEPLSHHAENINNNYTQLK